ncbi:MAG: class II aldolase/adducin family protein, partial [Proteobacteria bacterium]|nr:class II aldolase/adducin family protein [Pseudomonadota bacterium]
MASKKNPFVQPSPLQKVLLLELAGVAKRCYDRGWSWGTAGNFSIRGDEGVIWQSPTGLCKGDLKPDLFIPVDLESETSLEKFSMKPSAEMPVHAAIYKLDAKARCVVHTHPTESVALSLLTDEFKFSGEEMIKVLGKHSHLEELSIPIFSNLDPENMVKFSSTVDISTAMPSKLVFLKGHGVYAWGKTPLEA